MRDALEFVYCNHRGEIARRRVWPYGIYWGQTDWHPEPQWLLQAYDLDKGVERDFAMKDMTFAPAPAPRGDVGELVERLRTALQLIADVWAFRSELSTNYEDLAANLAARARSALKETADD